MSIIEFIEQLKSIAPSESSLKKLGLEQDFINEYRERYFINKRLPNDTSISNPILD